MHHPMANRRRKEEQASAVVAGLNFTVSMTGKTIINNSVIVIAAILHRTKLLISEIDGDTGVRVYQVTDHEVVVIGDGSYVLSCR